MQSYSDMDLDTFWDNDFMMDLDIDVDDFDENDVSKPRPSSQDELDASSEGDEPEEFDSR